MQPPRPTRATIDMSPAADGTFDQDAYAVMNTRDNALIESELGHPERPMSPEQHPSDELTPGAWGHAEPCRRPENVCIFRWTYLRPCQ